MPHKARHSPLPRADAQEQVQEQEQEHEEEVEEEMLYVATAEPLHPRHDQTVAIV